MHKQFMTYLNNLNNNLLRWSNSVLLRQFNGCI